MRDLLPPAGAERRFRGPKRRAASPFPLCLTRAPALLYTLHLLAPPLKVNLGLVTTTPAWNTRGARTFAGTWPPSKTKDPRGRNPKLGQATPEITCGQAAHWGQPVMPALAPGQGAVDSCPAHPSSNHSDSGPLLSPGPPDPP